VQPLSAFFRFTGAAFAMLCLSSPATVQPPRIVSGMDAVVGQAGWYTSDVILHTASFIDPDITISVDDIRVDHEGFNEVPIPDGMGGTAIQLINIDKTAPSVRWNSLPYSEVTAKTSGLSAEIADQGSGICLVELSTDHGRTWIEGWNAVGFALKDVVKESTWSYHFGFPEFDNGPHTLLLRARDCAGNISQGESLIVKMIGKG